MVEFPDTKNEDEKFKLMDKEWYNLWENFIILDNSNECKKQIAFADVILLNKTDLIAAQDLDKLEQDIKIINPLAKIHCTQK